jgi:hypothetical protein
VFEHTCRSKWNCTFLAVSAVLLFAWNAAAQTNLAQGRTATQSSTYGPTTGASNAVDGNTDGSYWDGSITHTNLDANAWWQVDLGASAAVGSISIWNRTDCCPQRLNDYWVFGSDTPFGPSDTPATLQSRAGTWSSHQTGYPNPSTTITLNATGRYVRVQLSGTNYLSLAEVQVYGTFLTNSDLAQGKTAAQSSTYGPTTGAANAVDGNADGNYWDGSITHTNLDANAWWQVDLGASAAVGSISIWNRTDCCPQRLNDYWVFVSDTPFGASDTPATLQNRAGTWSSHQTSYPNPSTTITLNAQGRYVRVQLSGTNYLSLAEVQVFGTFQAAPDFTIGVPSGPYYLMSGGSVGNIPVTITSVNGFSSQVTLSAASWPSGLHATFQTNPSQGSTIMTIRADPGTNAQIDSLRVLGSAGTLNHMTAPLTADVQDFTLNALQPVQPSGAPSLPPLTIPLLQSRSLAETVTSQNGFASPVSLNWSVIPPGLMATSFSATATPELPGTVAPGPLSTSTISSNTTGNYTMTLQGSNAGDVHTQDVSVAIVPAVPSMAPTQLEINLGPMPIDRYFLSNSYGDGSPILHGCDPSWTVQQCIRYLFTGPNNYPSQGVTGVRFFFAMAGGVFSTPYTWDPATHVPPTTVDPTWTQNLLQFFKDLRRYGIQRVTPTPVFDGWSLGSAQPVSKFNVPTCFDANGNSTVTSPELDFYPWLPYGLTPPNDPDCPSCPERDCHDTSYNNAAQTPDDVFWGWQPFFTLINTVLAQVQNANRDVSITGPLLDIPYLDYFQESNMEFTAQARMLYDPYRQVDVLQQLSQIMSANGFDPGKVAPSASAPEKPSVPSGNCGSVYGDSALILPVSELTAAIYGWAVIGKVPVDSDVDNHGLYCTRFTSTGTMIVTGHWHPQPSFIDMHASLTYSGISHTSTDLANTTTWSQNVYSALWSFLYNRTLTGMHAVIGETNPVQAGPDWGNNPDRGCQQFTKEEAAAMVSGYRSSSLYTAAQNGTNGTSVVMRPWHDLVNYRCTPSPHIINPPFNPFAQ